MIRESSIPYVAALVFGAFFALATASLHTVLGPLANEAGVDEWALIAVPALLAMLSALVVYRRAIDRVKNIGQSLSRGLLVALLTWVAFSALISWGWCIQSLFASCMTKAMMISGALAGGQLLLASLVAAAIIGYVIRGLTSGTRKAKD